MAQLKARNVERETSRLGNPLVVLILALIVFGAVVGSVAAARRSTCLRCVSRIAAATALAIAIVSLLGGLGAVTALRVGVHLLGLLVCLIAVMADKEQRQKMYQLFLQI